MPVLNPKGLIDNRVQAYKDIHEKTHALRATVGVSGGADSALVASLVTMAVGPGRVTAVWQGANSDPAALERARELCKNLGVQLIECDWTEDVLRVQRQGIEAAVRAGYNRDEIMARISAEPDILGGHRSCFRAPSLRLINRLTGNGLVHGTGNEDEDRFMRFFQKGGDGEVDTNAISMCSKGEVWQSLLALPTTPRKTLEANPSPDLHGVGESKHTDDTEMKKFLGMSDCTIPVYSFINLETGAYKNVGLIERVNRFLDDMISIPGDPTHPDRYSMDELIEEVLFGPAEPDLDTLMCVADASGYFKGIDIATIGRLLGAARRVEAMTRHKFNPMLDTLGDRNDLLDAGLLTNELPV